MMTRFAVATAAVLLGCGSAYAQAPLSTSPLPPLGVTSPLGIPNAPVGHTGVPLGATELATPGREPDHVRHLADAGRDMRRRFVDAAVGRHGKFDGKFDDRNVPQHGKSGDGSVRGHGRFGDGNLWHCAL